MEFPGYFLIVADLKVVWILVAMLSWSIYSIIIKEKKINLRPFVLLQTLITFGVILLAPIYFLEVASGKHFPLNLPVFLTIGYVVYLQELGLIFFGIELL